MLTYQIMDESCPVPTCLHGAPVLLSECRPGAGAYVETISSITPGSVADALAALARQYGASGVMAVDADRVVGKIRFLPKALHERIGGLCVQQEDYIRPLLTALAEPLPTQEEAPVLRLVCIQVAADYCGSGLAGRMLDAAIEWARRAGWQALQVTAIGHIPPLLNWSGQLSRTAVARRGFQTLSQEVHPALREGVVAQRTGAHGADVLAQWTAFASLSDDEAGTMYEMALPLCGEHCP